MKQSGAHLTQLTSYSHIEFSQYKPICERLLDSESSPPPCMCCLGMKNFSLEFVSSTFISLLLIFQLSVSVCQAGLRKPMSFNWQSIDMSEHISANMPIQRFPHASGFL
ncbi:hypothetical protein AMECASPLE_019466 [Ameca splendens]|uniref:Uncharacterized protein n=1 Tax=Ameca splendens TaxID=208324 RepID=A0ABV0Z1G4_9TELE